MHENAATRARLKTGIKVLTRCLLNWEFLLSF